MKTEEAEIKGSQFIKLFPLDEKSPHYVTGAAKSLCYIETPDKKASGFLIKFMMNYKDFYCLMTNEHVVEEKLVKNRDIITFYFDNKNKSRRIILDKNNRLIKHFKNDLTIDATVIEILPKDNIPNDYFLIADSYYMNKNNFEKLKGNEITILQYPSGKYDEGKYSTGKLIEIFGDDKNKYEFSHSASTFRGSSGSPIFLKKNTVKIIGIHKSGVSSLENYGDFIGPIYNYFKYYLSNIKDIYNNDRKGEKLAENPKNNNSTKIKDGFGKYIYENGEYYVGEWKNYLRNGKGRLYYKNGKIKYRGNWVDDEKDGKGKLFDENGKISYDGI